MTENTADIVLAICPPWGVVNPPLGPAYLASNLQKNGLSACVFDVNIALYGKVTPKQKDLWLIKNDNTWRGTANVDQIFAQWKDVIDELVDEIIATGIVIVGFTIVDPNEIFTGKFIKILKERKPELTVIAGGPGCGAAGQRQFLNNLSEETIDYFIVGEGEHALGQLLFALTSGERIPGGPQIIDARTRQEEVVAIPRVDLDSIVYPRFDEFELQNYSGESLAVMWSRGCIGRCVYCKEKALWGNYRVRSVQDIIDELQFCVKSFRITNFVVYDSAVNGNPKHLEALCDAILEIGLKITWSGEAIALKAMSFGLLKKMKKAGCHTLVYGIESGSDRVLSSMGKLSSSSIASDVIRDTSRSGIKVAVNILVGFPGETEEDFQETVDFLKKHSPWIDRIDSVSTLQVVTDTPLATMISDFDVVLPSIEPHDKWYTVDKANTHEIRQQRLERILTVAGEKGFEIGRTFLNENRKLKEHDKARKKNIFSQLLDKFKRSC